MRYLYITLISICLTSHVCSAQIITTVAGNGTTGYSGDGGQATAAEFRQPWGVAIDLVGNLFISDDGNVVIRKVNTAGILTTIAGNYTATTLGDGGPATLAGLDGIGGVATDTNGNIYIADGANDRIRIVNTNGIINTIAGSTNGYSGDGGQATLADLNNPVNMAKDVQGNLYIADFGNNVIRKVNTAGIINTIVGNGIAGYSGDGGPATSAQIHDPFCVAIDMIGNIYIADTYNAVVRKVNTLGMISTIAGTGLSYGYSGDGGQATLAKFNQIEGLTTDAMGNIYVSDYGNNRVRKVNTNGIINTIVGTGVAGYSGDGGTASFAELNVPVEIALDVLDNLYIAEWSNNRIRKVTNVATAGIEPFATNNEQVTIYPNPATNKTQA